MIFEKCTQIIENYFQSAKIYPQTFRKSFANVAHNFQNLIII